MPPIFSLFLSLWGLSHSEVNGQGAEGDLPIGLFPLSALGLQSSVAAADSRSGIDGRLSSPPSGGAEGGVSCTLDALCIDQFSGQSWPILDFPLGEFSAGLCRFLLPSPLGACRSPLWLCTGCFSSLWFCLVVRIWRSYFRGGCGSARVNICALP